MNLLNDPTPIEFETDRLIIKRGNLDYANQLFDAARESIETIYPFLPWCHPNYEMKDAEQWLEQCPKGWAYGINFAFCIFDRNDTFLGGCGLNKIDGHPVANLGYWLRTTATGKGYAAEATKGLANFAFEHLSFRRMELIMATHNKSSQQVAVNADAVFEGTLRSRLELHGRLHDAYLYSLIG